MWFISLWSVFHALKGQRCWAFCAAIATDQPLPCEPNVRMLRGTAAFPGGREGNSESG